MHYVWSFPAFTHQEVQTHGLDCVKKITKGVTSHTLTRGVNAYLTCITVLDSMEVNIHLMCYWIFFYYYLRFSCTNCNVFKSSIHGMHCGLFRKVSFPFPNFKTEIFYMWWIPQNLKRIITTAIIFFTYKYENDKKAKCEVHPVSYIKSYMRCWHLCIPQKTLHKSTDLHCLAIFWIKW